MVEIIVIARKKTNGGDGHIKSEEDFSLHGGSSCYKKNEEIIGGYNLDDSIRL